MPRFLILKDKKITEEQLDELERQFTDLVYKATGLSPVFFVEERDYSHVPTESDSDGDLKPTHAYMTALMAGVYKKYGTYGVEVWFHWCIKITGSSTVCGAQIGAINTTNTTYTFAGLIKKILLTPDRKSTRLNSSHSQISY